jgi:hypothetical protein
MFWNWKFWMFTPEQNMRILVLTAFIMTTTFGKMRIYGRLITSKGRFILLRNYKKTIAIFMLLITFLFSCSDQKKTETGSDNQPEQRPESPEQIAETRERLYKALDEKNVSEIVEVYKTGMDNNYGQPLLVLATNAKWDEGVIALLNAGADPYCMSNQGALFFQLAIVRLQEETSLYIINNGFDVMKLGDYYVKKIFTDAVSAKKVKLQKRLLEINGLVETLTKKSYNDDELGSHFMRYWTDGTAEILENLLKNGLVMPGDSSLYAFAIMEANSVEAVEWLINHGFLTSVPDDEKNASYYGDWNLSLQIKSIDYNNNDPDYNGPKLIPEDSIHVINARRIKELIEENDKQVSPNSAFPLTSSRTQISWYARYSGPRIHRRG